MISQLVFIPLGAALMSVNKWLPMMMSSALMILGIFLALALLPETLPAKKKAEDEADLITERADMDDRSSPRQNGTHTVDGGKSTAIKKVIAKVVSMINVHAVLIILAFLAIYLGEQVQGPVFLQYISKKLHWTIAKARHRIFPFPSKRLLPLSP